MFAVPPASPRYVHPVTYATGTVDGMPVPVSETMNTIKHLKGGCPLEVREGTYELKEDLFLAPPPPLPIETPVIPRIPNPLSTTEAPPTQGVKVSAVYIQTPEPPFSFFSRSASSERDRDSYSEPRTLPPIYGEWNPSLSPSPGEEKSKGKDGLKRAKPKTNIVRSTSTYVSRVQDHEMTPRRLVDRPLDGLFAFVNVGRSFQWLDMTSPKNTDPFMKILFASAHMLCHDVNEASKTPNHLDVIMGSSTSDILWYEPMSQRYTRINKNGSTNSSPVLHIKWIPRSDRLFLAAHSDGSLIVYDKGKENDGTFASESADLEESYISGSTTSSSRDSVASYRAFFRVIKSVNSPKQNKNPIAVYKLSTQPINHFAFSPDERHIAAVLEDGTLRIADLHAEKCLDVFHSYYGGLTCVCWSPDGKYIVTGGQDDLVTIWSFVERRIVARCQGHTSWVQNVAFDPWKCELEQGNYRFGSVGDDCRLCLWDFDPAMLHRSRHGPLRSRASATAQGRPPHHESTHLSPERGPDTCERIEPVIHPVEKRASTAQLPPILSKIISHDPVLWLGFLEDRILTSSLEGHLRTWNRPCPHKDQIS